MKNFNLHKYSLDTSFLVKKDDPRGDFGVFTSQYDKDQKRQIKDKLGLTVEENTGIKKFHQIGIEEVQEALALYYIGPYIKAKTTLGVAEPTQPLTFSTLFLNKIMPVTKINGIILGEIILYDGVGHINFHVGYDIINATMDKIHRTLESIGVHHGDLQETNVMVMINENFITDYANRLRISKSPEDISMVQAEMAQKLYDKAVLIDFGFIWCSEDTEPGMKLKKLFNKIQEMPVNYYTDIISYAINDCLYGFNDNKEEGS